jgi:hypothetical protein
MGVEPELAQKSGYFAIILIPVLWTTAVIRVLQKYLQAQNIMNPSMVSGALGLVVNLIVNCLLLFISKGGYIGVAFTLCFTRLVMLLYLVYYISNHPSIDVSVSVWFVAVGFIDIISGIAPKHTMFKQYTYHDSSSSSSSSSSRGRGRGMDQYGQDMERTSLMGDMDTNEVSDNVYRYMYVVDIYIYIYIYNIYTYIHIGGYIHPTTTPPLGE